MRKQILVQKIDEMCVVTITYQCQTQQQQQQQQQQQFTNEKDQRRRLNKVIYNNVYSYRLVILIYYLNCTVLVLMIVFSLLGIPQSTSSFCIIDRFVLGRNGYLDNHGRNIVQVQKVVTLLSSSLSLSASSGSSSEQERRREEERRKERRDDVIIGQTSAKPGETDYELNVAATESSYLQQASSVEKKIYSLTDLALSQLKSYKLDTANECYNKIYSLKPTAYVWQAGIVKFYLNDFTSAATIFANSAQLFESKFGEPATEERIWRQACALKLYNTMSKQEQKQLSVSMKSSLTSSSSSSPGTTSSSTTITNPIESLVPPIPVSEYVTIDVLLRAERRKVMRIIRELFSSSIDNNIPSMIVSRAKLEAMAGVVINAKSLSRGRFKRNNNNNNNNVNTTSTSTTSLTESSTTAQAKPKGNVILDRKLWKLNSLYYLGLHYDVMGNTEASQQCMKYALQLCPSGNSNDIIYTLPTLHMTTRDWYDNEPMVLIDSQSIETSSSTATAATTTLLDIFHIDDSIRALINNNNNNNDNNNKMISNSPYDIKIQLVSIQNSIINLRLVDLQQSMRLLGQKVIGNKEELQQRLFYSIIDSRELYT